MATGTVIIDFGAFPGSNEASVDFVDATATNIEPVEAIEQKAERDAKRIISIGRVKAKPAPPKIRITTAVDGMGQYLDAVLAKIDRVYWQALGDALARDAEEDEDIAFLATLQ